MMPTLPALDTPLRGIPFAAFDFETVGLQKGARWPVSVAVVHGELGRPGTSRVVYHTLVKPHCDVIPEGATAIHGITMEMVNKPDIPNVAHMLEEVLPLFEGRVPMAYNLAYDWSVMSDCMWLCGASMPAFAGLDPYIWAKVVDRNEKGKGRHKLTEVCKRRGIEFLAHDSKNDVLATAEVAPLLLRQLRDQEGLKDELESLGAFLAWQERVALADEVRFRDWLLRQADPPATVGMPWHELLGVDAGGAQ